MAFGTLIPWAGAPRSGSLRAADHLLDDFWNGLDRFPSMLGESLAHFVPRIDVEESDAEYRVVAELPGLEEKDFEVLLEDDVLTLKGEKRNLHEEERAGVHRTETACGQFTRRLRFATPIAADAVKATYRNGVLRIVLPKPEEARPQVRNIPIESA